MLTNSKERYGVVAQCIHWATAVLIFALLAIGLFMVDLPEGSADEVAEKTWFFSLHKTIGILAFGLAVIRVIWALAQPHPRPLNSDRTLETLAAQTVHWTLYGAILLMPLTGWLHHSALEGFAPIWGLPFQDLPLVPKDPMLAELFGLAHVSTLWLLAGAMALHIAGALKHLIVDRDQTIQRMLPGFYKPGPGVLHEPRFKGLSRILSATALATLVAVIGCQYQAPQITRTEPATQSTPAPSTAASGWTVDHGKSQLAIEVLQSGKPIMGHFPDWSATIDFDPEDLENAKVQVMVTIGSLALGGVSEKAVSVDFLNAPAYPLGSFTASQFISSGPEQFEAQGELDLAGHKKPLTLPFTLRIENDRAFAEGSTVIKRLDHGIGAKGFPGEAMVGYDVVVTIKVEATR